MKGVSPDKPRLGSVRGSQPTEGPHCSSVKCRSSIAVRSAPTAAQDRATLMWLVSLAYAHPSAVPHVHATDPWASAILAFWAVAAGVFLTAAYRLRRDTAPSA